MAEAMQFAGEAAVSNAMLFWLGGQCCAVAADRVVRVVAAQPLRRLPLLPPHILGVAALSGKIVPVLDLRRLLDLPDGDQADGELLLVAIGTENYAFCVDHVMQIVACISMAEIQWRQMPVHFIDVDALLENCLRESAAAPAVLTAGTGHANAAGMPAVPVQTPAGHIRGKLSAANLAVETASSHDLLPLDIVIELRETLVIAAVPDPRPLLAGAAFYRDTLLPVISLDALLGRPQAGEGDRGAFVIVEFEGRRCALAVKRVIGMSAESEHVTDLRPILTRLLPEPETARSFASMAPVEMPAQNEEARYLLAELAGRTCAFALLSVVHIHTACRVIQAPAGGRNMAVGVTAIGGRVLPVLDLAARLGLSFAPAAEHFIELKSPQTGTFVIAVDRIIGIAAIERDSLIAPPPGSPISAVALQGAHFIWIIDASSIAKGGGWRSDAA